MAQSLTDEDLKRRETIHRVMALFSSLLFFLGSAVFVVYVIAETEFEEAKSFANSILSKLTISIGYLLLSIHALFEIIIDCQKVPRIFAHSRYGRVFGTKRSYGVDLRNLNILQSVLFLSASLSEMLAFLSLFQLRRIDLYSYFNVAGSCLFLTSAALTLVIRGCCWVRWSRSLREMLDQTANGLYVISSVAWMFACLNQFENFHDATVGALLQDICMCTFAVCGLLYFLGDLRHLCEESELGAYRRPLVRDNEGSDSEDEISEPRQRRRSSRKKRTKSSSKHQNQPAWTSTATSNSNIVTEKYSSDQTSDNKQIQLAKTDIESGFEYTLEELAGNAGGLEQPEERTPAPAVTLTARGVAPTSPVESIEMSTQKPSHANLVKSFSSMSGSGAEMDVDSSMKKQGFFRRGVFNSETLAV